MTTYFITTAVTAGAKNVPGSSIGDAFPVAQLFPKAVTGDTIETPIFCKDTAPFPCTNAQLYTSGQSGWASALTLFGSMDGVTGWTLLGTNSAAIGSYKFIKGVATLNIPSGWIGDPALGFLLKA